MVFNFNFNSYFFSNSCAYNLKGEIKLPKLNQKTQNIINLAIFNTLDFTGMKKPIKYTYWANPDLLE